MAVALGAGLGDAPGAARERGRAADPTLPNVVEYRWRLRPTRPPRVRRGGGWTSFAVGVVAGGLVVGVGTIAVVRQPAMQRRLGIVEPSPPLVASRRPEACPAPTASEATRPLGLPGILLSKKRFWSVPPP